MIRPPNELVKNLQSQISIQLPHLVQNSDDESLSTTSIDQKWVRQFDYEKFSLSKLDDMKVQSEFKILKLINCPEIDETLKHLENEKIFEAVIESSHLFVISLETKGEKVLRSEKLSSVLPSINGNRPLIVQHSLKGKKPLIFFMDSKCLAFHRIHNLQDVNREVFIQKVKTTETFSLFSLLEAFNSNMFGSFKGNILEIKLKKNIKEQKFLTELCSKNVLCLRFLKLFQPSEGYNCEKILQAIDNEGIEIITSALDLSFLTKIEKEDENCLKTDIKTQLLTSAIEQKNFEAVKLLSTLDNQNKVDEKAANLAWTSKSYDCLSQLISYDSCFPKNFNASDIDSGEPHADKLKKIVAERILFHDAIKTGSLPAIKKFMENNSNIKIAYDTSNNPAVFTALESKQFDIYSLLRSQGFSASSVEEILNFIKKLNAGEKGMIRDSNLKYFKSLENSHLYYILAKIKLGYNAENREKIFEVIRKMLDELNEIPEICLLMKVVEQSADLKIFFDFNSSHVADMDPTSSEEALGVCYNLRGDVFVGARDYETKFYLILGTFAHELSHYALELIYQNDCNPYEANDTNLIVNFHGILTAIKKHCDDNKYSIDSIISTVFLYDEKYYKSELIARVPHLMARYKNNLDTLNDIRSTYCKELFDFFTQHVAKDLKINIDKIQPKSEICEINEMSGVLNRIWYSDMRLNERAVKDCEKVFRNQNSQLTIISSNAPQVTMAMIFQHFLNQLDIMIAYLHLFLKTEHFKNADFRSKILKVFNSGVNPMIFIDETDDISPKIEDFQCHERIFLVTHQENMAKVDTTDKNVIIISHSWGDLTKENREVLLKTKVSFQGRIVMLENIFSPSLLCNFLPLHELTTEKFIEVGESFGISQDEFFIDRNFQTSSSAATLTLENILEETNEHKIVMISDVAGTGKTSVLKNIAKVLKNNKPTSWIVFIDLKQHSNSFQNFIDEKSQDFRSFPDFLIETVMQPKKFFDRELFLELFSQGKVFVIFDGFDEISPQFNELIIKLFKLFDVELGNQMWIATRRHLKHELEKNLKLFSCSILPLTTSEQVKFLVEMWESSEILLERNNLEAFAKLLIEKLSKALCENRSNLIGIPLLLRIIGEIYQNFEGSFNQSLDSFAIFKAFMKKLIEIWVEKCNAAEKEDTLAQTTTLISIHHKLALRNVFKTSQNFEYNQVQWSNEKIARLGIIFFESFNGEPKFLHETFVDYLVSDYFLRSLESGESYQEISKIFLKILTTKQFEIVRAFVNIQIVNIDLSNPNRESFFKAFKALVEESNSYEVLSIVLEEGLENLLKFILNFLETNEDLKIKVLLSVSPKNENLLMKATSKNLKIFKFLLDSCEESLQAEDFKNLISARSDEVGNLLHYSLLNDGEESEEQLEISCFIEKAEKVLNKDELKQLVNEKTAKGSLNSLCFGVSKCKRQEVFRELLKLLRNLPFHREDLLRLLLENDINSKKFIELAISLSSKQIIEITFEFLSEMDVEDQKLVVQIEKEEDRTKMLLDAIANNNNGVLTTVWSYMSNFMTLHEKKNLLQLKNKAQRNIFHEISISSSANVLREFFAILMEVFEPKDIMLYVLEVDEVKRDVFFLSAALNKQEHCLKTLWEFASGIFNQEDQSRILHFEDFYGNSLFHLASAFNNSFVIKDLIEILKVSLTKDQFVNMLQDKNFFGLTVINIMVMYNHENALQEFISEVFESKYLTIQETQKIVLLKESEYNRNLISLAAKSNKNEKVFEVLSKFLEKVFDTKDYEVFFYDVDKYSFNSLHLAIKHNSENVVKKLCEIVKYQKSVRKTVLSCENHKKVNIFHLNYNMLTVLWENLCDVITKRELKSVLLEENAFGSDSHLLYVYILKNDSKKLKEYLKIAVTVFADSEIKNILLQTDKNFKRNSLSYVASKTNEPVFMNFMFELAKTVFLPQELRDLLNKQDRLGKNLLKVAAQNSNKNVLQSVILIIEQVFDKKEIQNMLQIRSKNGNSIFLFAAENKKNSNIFEILYMFFEKYFSKLEIRSILDLVNTRKLKIFHEIWGLNNEFAMEEFLNISRHLYTLEERKTFFSAITTLDSKRLNCFLQSVEYNRNQNLIKALDRCAKETLTEDEHESLINEMRKDRQEKYKSIIQS